MPGSRSKDITAKRFNRWIAIERTSKDKLGYWKWIFECQCGKTKELSINTVTRGLSKSCGCLKTEILRSRTGSKNNFWKGGITKVNRAIRESFDYRKWRHLIYERDNYTCQECGYRGGTLNAHHIKSFAYFPELRFNLENGVTLCLECHKLTDNYSKKIK